MKNLVNRVKLGPITKGEIAEQGPKENLGFIQKRELKNTQEKQQRKRNPREGADKLSRHGGGSKRRKDEEGIYTNSQNDRIIYVKKTMSVHVAVNWKIVWLDCQHKQKK